MSWLSAPCASVLLSGEISLGGNVSASGTWDVSVTDAAVTLSSAGADLVEQTVVNDPTYEVVLYDVYADYSFLGDYCFTVDDNNPHTVSLTAEEFNPYDEDNGKQIGAYSFKSGVSGTAYSRSDYTFVLNCREEAEHMVTGWENNPSLPAADNGAMDGQCIGQAVALRYNTQMPMNERIIMSHDDAKAFYQANPRTETTVPAETTFTAGSVSYAPGPLSRRLGAVFRHHHQPGYRQGQPEGLQADSGSAAGALPGGHAGVWRRRGASAG